MTHEHVRKYGNVRKGASFITKNNMPPFHVVGNKICIGQIKCMLIQSFRMTSLVCKEIAQICLQNVLIPRFNVFFIKPYTDQYFTYYYVMSANWASVKIMVPSECRPTGFLPTARPLVHYRPPLLKKHY